jgi:hypothetical protein
MEIDRWESVPIVLEAVEDPPVAAVAMVVAVDAAAAVVRAAAVDIDRVKLLYKV